MSTLIPPSADRRAYFLGVGSLILRILAALIFLIAGFCWAVDYPLPRANAWLLFGLFFFAASFV